MKPHVVFVDVDDTLIRSMGTKRIPMPGVVAAVRLLKANGATLYLWSSGGADYARSSADELGITDCFVGFLPKPHVMIDDQPIHQWHTFQHVYPAQASEALVEGGA
jgi:cation transport ATPase